MDEIQEGNFWTSMLENNNLKMYECFTGISTSRACRLRLRTFITTRNFFTIYFSEIFKNHSMQLAHILNIYISNNGDCVVDSLDLGLWGSWVRIRAPEFHVLCGSDMVYWWSKLTMKLRYSYSHPVARWNLRLRAFSFDVMAIMLCNVGDNYSTR